MAGRKWRRIYRPPDGSGGAPFWQGGGVSPHVLVLCPAFLPVLAALSPKSLEGREWKTGEEKIERKKVSLVFRDRAAVPQVGPLAVKTLLLAYGLFTSRPHGLVKGAVPDDALSFSLPVWDAALLFGVEGIGDVPVGEDGKIGAEDYARLSSRLRDFEDRIRAALRLLASVSVLIGGETVSLISKSSCVRGGGIFFSLSPSMGVVLAKSGAAHVPAALFRLPVVARTAFALGLKVSAYVSIRRNYRRGKAPGSLRVRSLLAATPLHSLGDVAPSGKSLRKTRGWREWGLDPFEKGMARLTVEGIFASWGYASGKKGEDFRDPEKWAAEKVVFVLSDPPKIVPPKWKKKGAKDSPDEEAKKPKGESR